MIELLTAGQMRAIERAAMEAGDTTGLQLMERAGQGVVGATFEQWPDFATTPRNAVVLCGPGNNGGDGFVIARLLQDRGWQVEAWLAGDPGRLTGDAAVNHARWAERNRVRKLPYGGASPEIDEPDDVGLRLYSRSDVALFVDALFGTGLTRGIDPVTAAQSVDILSGKSSGAEMRPQAGHKVVAVDVPSGLCADSGRVIGGDHPSVAPADLTVTFHCPKRGHMLGAGPALCGTLKVVDIGLSPKQAHRALSSCADQAPLARLNDAFTPPAGSAPNVATKARVPGRGGVWASAHKYGHGHALILSGGPGRGGAARLAARGALRIGAGLVTVGCPPEALAETAARLDAIMCRPIGDAVAFAETLADPRFNALCLGPGLGVGETTRVLVKAALSAKRATVLDADALTSFADDPATLFSALHPDCVLTPHMGEFARLFPDLAAQLDGPAVKGPAYSRIDAAIEAARIAGCTVLLKGADTVIADAKGNVVVNAAHYDRAAPWLATAGSGDVLAGFITGLLARGWSAVHSARIGAWLHVEAAREFGPGLISEDLPEQLPRVLAGLARAGDA